MAGNNKRYLRSKAQEWALGESEGGKPYVAVSFKVKDTDGEEKFVSWRGFFTEATTERTIEALRYMGFEGDDLATLVGLDKHEVELVVEDEEYEGKTYARVQWVNKPKGPAVKTVLEGQKLSAFAASMKSAFRAHDASNGKRTSTAKAPAGDKCLEPLPLSDVDIPF